MKPIHNVVREVRGLLAKLWGHQAQSGGRAQCGAPSVRVSSMSLESLETRQMLNGAPVFEYLGWTKVSNMALPTATYQSPAGKPLLLPIAAKDADGDALTYTITSSNPAITATLRRNTTFLKITTTANGTTQDMVFELLRDIAPRTVDTMTGLVRGELYNGKSFYRIANLAAPGAPSAYIIQGGVSGSSSAGFTFDDEFSPYSALFTGKGQLAMAKSADDTNSTEMFITNGQPRHLDFNHTVWGQLVRGWETLNALIGIGGDPSTGVPKQNITITKAEIVRNVSDAVISINAASGASGTVTVAVNDGKGHITRSTIKVIAVPDRTYSGNGNLLPVNEPPILYPSLQKQYWTAMNKTFTLPLKAWDLEGNKLKFRPLGVSIPPGTSGGMTGANSDVLAIVPPTGFTGAIKVRVQAYHAASDPDSDTGAVDSQDITIMVGTPHITLAKGTPFQAVAGVRAAAGYRLAYFMDADANAKVGDYSASIQWGDSTVSNGEVRRDANGTFWVYGYTAYRSEGSFPVTVTITRTASGESAVATTAATVLDAPITVRPVKIYGVEETALSSSGAILAKFTDADIYGIPADFTATIAWGDGQSGAATINKDYTVPGGFNVVGNHTYAAPGDRNVVITIRNAKTGAVLRTVTSTASIGRSSMKVDIGSAYGFVNEGQTFVRSGTFTDQALAPKGPYTVKVDYGDGSAVQTLTPGQNNGFNLSHLYADNGSFPLVVTVTDGYGITTSATVSMTVNTVAPTVNVPSTTPTFGVSGQLRTIQFNATGSTAAHTAAGFTFTINWGEGADQTIPSTQHTGPLYWAKHTYNAPGTYNIKITAKDKDGATGTKTFSMVIEKAMLQTDPTDSSKMALFVGGTVADDTIQLLPASNGRVDVMMNGSAAGATFNPTGNIYVFGNDGNDSISAVNLARDVMVFGGPGNDSLLGGSGNDVIQGDAGLDQLVGNGGKDILIGGAGQDYLRAGDGEDILIGGTTRADGGLVLLDKVLAQWTRSGVAYATRVAQLRGSVAGSLAGTFTFSSTNIIADKERDYLNGQAGLDFFCGVTTGRTNVVTDIFDNGSGEIIVAL